MAVITFKKFQQLAKDHNLIVLEDEILADTETPVSVLQRLGDEPYAFLFESVEGQERWAQYSFIGCRPLELFRSFRSRFEYKKNRGSWQRKKVSDPLRELERRLGAYRPAWPSGVPRFAGGAVGYLGYDIIRFIERLPRRKHQVIDPWDMYFMIPQVVFVFDNREHLLKLLYHVPIRGRASLRKVYDEAVQDVRGLMSQIQGPKAPRKARVAKPKVAKFRTLWNKQDFLRAVRRIKEYIRAGDVIQTVLSLRFQASWRGEGFDLYRALRYLNPSPYMFYLRMGDHEVVGASPETMVRLEGRELTLRPIAGTRPRGRTEAKDRAFEEDLLADPKECAEHIMLVDLGRNDLGRVAERGSVEVNELMVIERYSHVMHIVSNVRARLVPGKGPFDVIRATFPAGTLSGAPKVRAMEIIDELEPSRRGIYGGCVGYIDFSGNMDTAIAIRTAIIQDGKVSIQAGAGIVADSDPVREYEECMNKAGALFRAVEMAEKRSIKG